MNKEGERKGENNVFLKLRINPVTFLVKTSPKFVIKIVPVQINR